MGNLRKNLQKYAISITNIQLWSIIFTSYRKILITNKNFILFLLYLYYNYTIKY